MTRIHPFRIAALSAACALLQLLPLPAAAALYKPGDVAQDFSFIARKDFRVSATRTIRAGDPVKLSDLAGRIVFLEWFAVWCPFCVAAAPQVQQGIDEYYKSRGGNPQGVEVLHVAVNQEARSNYQTSTDGFVARNAFAHVVNDYTSSSVNDVRFRFQNTGQPIFVVINGVTNSPSHKPWEILVNHLGYGDTDFTTELGQFRARIDAVKAAPPAPFELSLPTVSPGSPASFTVAVPKGRTAIIQWTLDLANWNKLKSVEGTGEPVTVTDPNPSSEHRYYRAILP